MKRESGHAIWLVPVHVAERFVTTRRQHMTNRIDYPISKQNETTYLSSDQSFTEPSWNAVASDSVDVSEPSSVACGCHATQEHAQFHSLRVRTRSQEGTRQMLAAPDSDAVASREPLAEKATYESGRSESPI